MSFRRHHVDLQFAVILKKRYTRKKYTVATCIQQKIATSDEDVYVN